VKTLRKNTRLDSSRARDWQTITLDRLIEQALQTDRQVDMTKQENHLDLAFLYSAAVHSHGGGAKGTIVLVIADVAD
jgi:hypothetical protein